MRDDSVLLAGLTVVDMSQFLSGPYCSLRLADLGARVIKVERPDGGDLSRRLYLSDTEVGGDSTLFHTISRGTESLGVDLKNAEELAFLRRLLAKAYADPEFPPGIIERLGSTTRRCGRSTRPSSTPRSAAMARRGRGSCGRGRIFWRWRAPA